jgi:hypothetical protein
MLITGRHTFQECKYESLLVTAAQDGRVMSFGYFQVITTKFVFVCPP